MNEKEKELIEKLRELFVITDWPSAGIKKYDDIKFEKAKNIMLDAIRNAVAEREKEYEEIFEDVAKVYCHITNSRISKPNTKAEDVIAVADDIATEDIDKAVAEREGELEDAVKNIQIYHWHATGKKLLFEEDILQALKGGKEKS